MEDNRMVSGCNTSGLQTVTKLIVAGSRTRLASIRVSGTGATAGNITVYDSGTETTTNKKELAKMYVGGAASAHNYEFDMHGALALEGIYVVVSGAINYSIEYY
tara:strand:- start:4314 stop:4625 length:312 start_codon:yes stop_codon:yes gene_type:complete